MLTKMQFAVRNESHTHTDAGVQILSRPRREKHQLPVPVSFYVPFRCSPLSVVAHMITGIINLRGYLSDIMQKLRAIENKFNRILRKTKSVATPMH